jgi:hypothetical protein
MRHAAFGIREALAGSSCHPRPGTHTSGALWLDGDACRKDAGQRTATLAL